MFGTRESRQVWMESNPLIGGFIFVFPLAVVGGVYMLFVGVPFLVALVTAFVSFLVFGCVAWLMLRGTSKKRE